MNPQAIKTGQPYPHNTWHSLRYLPPKIAVQSNDTFTRQKDANPTESHATVRFSGNKKLL